MPRRPGRTVVTLTAIVATLLVAGATSGLSRPAAAAAEPPAIVSALDVAPATVQSVTTNADPDAVGVGSAPIAGFPGLGKDYLVLSTGRADALPGTADEFRSTDLEAAPGGADGNDLTQVTLTMRPPAGAKCLGFDFSFLSEEYPEYVGSRFDDIFTAELNESFFDKQNDQVVAPNNFAYDSQGNPVSINTAFGMAPAAGTAMDGATPALSASTPIKTKIDGSMDLILSIQDLGDSAFDSAAVVDDLRWLYGPNCARGATPVADTDGDGLPDSWETSGIDYDGDGVVDLDLPAMGADPKHKDLFAEVDWMVQPKTCIWVFCWGGKDLAPQQAALSDVRAAFAASPVPNPDGTTGVRAHIDAGPSSVMNPVTGATWGARSRANSVPFQDSLGTSGGGGYNWGAFDALKNANFATARRDAFHYVVYGNTYPSDPPGSSGVSRGLPASDYLVTDGDPSWNGGFTRTQERGTFMHELGHNLGLHHGGDIDQMRDASYRSIMSYTYQLTGLPPNSTLDYSRGAPFVDWDHLVFNGGSIGDLGDTAPLPDVTPTDDELSPSTAGATVARPGDGTAELLGPTVLVPNTGVAQMQVDVHNASTTPDTFTVTTNAPQAALTGTASVPVPARGTARVTIPVDTAKLTPASAVPVTLTVASTKAGPGLYESTTTVDIPDPSNPATKAAAQDAVAKLNALPAGQGPDPAVKAATVAMLTKLANPSWKAQIVLNGSTNATLAGVVAPPVFTPGATNPATIEAPAVAGSPVTSLSLRRIGPVGTAYTGQMRVTTPQGVITASVTGAWSAATSTFTGSWTSLPKSGGAVRFTMIKP